MACETLHWLVVLVHPPQVKLVGESVQTALSVSVEPVAGVAEVAVTVQEGEPAGGTGRTEPPAAQKATGCAGLPSPSAL